MTRRIVLNGTVAEGGSSGSAGPASLLAVGVAIDVLSRRQ